MAMTWKSLAANIKNMTDEQQNMDVTVVDPVLREAFPVEGCIGDDGSKYGLDDDSPYLILKNLG